MGPKKKDNIVDYEDMWRKIIEEAPLDEDNWSVKVILMEAAGSDQDRIYLNKFETYAAEEKRFVIKNICKTETVFMINQLGSEKKVKDETLRVFEEGNSYLKEKKDIPPDVYALIIKHLILKMKQEYLFIRGQRLEVQDGMRRESATMINKTEIRGTVSAFHAPVSDAQDTDPKSPDGKKYNTALRVRGEEWRDKVYVDDYPTDGPNLYVAITGFVEPLLAGCLIQVGIPLTSVVQIRIDATVKKVPSGLTRATKRGQSQTELLAEQSSKFWNHLQFLRIHEESANDYKNTAFIIFSPPYWESDDLSGDPDRIYDELCNLMYDIQDLSRQHEHYLNNMDIINVPESTYEEDDTTNYHKLIDDLPLECVTIYSILDSVLNAVCKNVDFGDRSKSSSSTSVTLNTLDPPGDKHKKSEKLVKEIFSTLIQTELNKKKYRLTYGEEYENLKDPIMIKYGDISKYNTFHLGNINLDKIVFSSLLGMPVHNLWQKQDRLSGELEAKVNFHVNMLLSCFDREDVETSELNRLVHVLACRKLYSNRSSLRKSHIQSTTISEFKKIYLKRSILAKPLPKCLSKSPMISLQSPSFRSMTQTTNEEDDPYPSTDDSEDKRIKYLFECPDISELVSAAELALNQPIKHIIDDFEFFEDFADTCAFQVMCQAFNNFNCVDYKFCEVTDCFVLMFFNSHDKDGISRDEWRFHLCTPVCLQDFFDYILEEHYDWIQNEEKLYDENLLIKARSESKHEIDHSVLVSCLEDTEVDTDLLMEGSLKHRELLAAEELDHDNLETVEQQIASHDINSSTAIPDKSGKKTKSPTTNSTKSVKQSTAVTSSDSLTNLKKPPKPFLGYDLGDRRFEVFGKDATFLSRDGTKVSSLYTLIIPLNLEYINLSIMPGNSGNEFSIHKALGEFVTPEIIDSCDSFRITSKDQIMINIIKRIYMAPHNVTRSSILDIMEKKSQVKGQVSAKISSHPLESERKYFHSLYLTWPNGMITETVHETNSAVLSHIKQFYVYPMPNYEEDMRCISLKGEVIIFKPTGEIEVLIPDGSCIKITKYYKKLVIPLGLQEEIEESSTKSKKTKNKLGKPSKISSKLSKNLLVDEEKNIEDKIPEYELIVDEFETIEANGFRKRYINNIPTVIEKILIRTATDYCVGEIFSRRMDGTNMLLNKDGVFVVTFPNKTRIITQFVIDDEDVYPEWTDQEKEYLNMFEPEFNNNNSKYSVSQKSVVDSESVLSKNLDEEEVKERSDGYVSVHIIYTIEHLNFSTVTINKSNDNVSIDSPNNTSVLMNKNNQYNITLDTTTSATFDGENLKISYEACPDCKSFTTCNVKIIPAEDSLTIIDNSWVQVKDSFCKNITVDHEGNIATVEESTDICQDLDVPVMSNLSTTPSFDEIPQADEVVPVDEAPENSESPVEKVMDVKSETSTVSHGKCREIYLANTLRFFVLTRELNCSELIHRALVDRYESDCRWQPWCSVNQYNTFGDHRSIVSIITPMHITESEKWKMNSKLADKPKYLTYKDLKPDCGKGFYHWMRPYKRFEPKPIKPESVLPPRLPRAYVLRTLERQWGSAEREESKGARELVQAILRYRAVMEADSENLLKVPIVDPRSEEDRRIDNLVQGLAHTVKSENSRATQGCVSQELPTRWRTACEASRLAVSTLGRRHYDKIYQDLRDRLADHVQSRARATITTKPLPRPPDVEQVEDEQFGEELSTTSREEVDQEGLAKQFSQMEEMSPNLQKYWRRRAEELKEEEFYKYLLREGNVPPYFRNVLGGAIWWEMNRTAGEAVTKSEKRKTKCVCAENIVRSEDGSNCDGYVLSGPFQ